MVSVATHANLIASSSNRVVSVATHANLMPPYHHTSVATHANLIPWQMPVTLSIGTSQALLTMDLFTGAQSSTLSMGTSQPSLTLIAQLTPNPVSLLLQTAIASLGAIVYMTPNSTTLAFNVSSTHLSTQIATVIKEQFVKVYTNTGVFIDVWRDAPLVGSGNFSGPQFALNTVGGQVTIKLPRSFDNFDETGDPRGMGTIGPGNIVQIWVVDHAPIPLNRLVWQGYIDAYTPSIDNQGNEQIEILLTPFDAVLGDVQFIGTQQFGTAGNSATYVDTVTMFNWPFLNTNAVTAHPYTYPLTIDAGNPFSSGSLYQLQFHNQTVASFFENVRSISPQNWYWFVTQNKTVIFRQQGATPQHKFTIGKDISQPQYQKNYSNLKNYIYVKGTGVSAIAQGSDISTYGQRTLTIVEPRLIDQTTCQAYANAVLTNTDRVDYRSKLTIVDYRGDINTSIGYDIEILSVGDTCQIINPYHNATNTLWDQALWDTDLWDYPVTAVLYQTVIIASLIYNFDSVDIELSTLQPSQDKFLTDLANRFFTYATY